MSHSFSTLDIASKMKETWPESEGKRRIKSRSRDCENSREGEGVKKRVGRGRGDEEKKGNDGVMVVL